MTAIKQQKQALPYFESSDLLFTSIANEKWSVFLDSGFPYCKQGRFDIIATDPAITLLSKDNITIISEHGNTTHSDEDPFSLVKHYLNRDLPVIEGIPFNGGAIGYFSYDLARRLEKLPVIAIDEENIADMAIGIYQWAVIVDHINQETWLVGNGIEQNHWQQLIDQFSLLPERNYEDTFYILDKTQSNMDKVSYQKAFDRIEYYLKEGDSYQVNLAQRFSNQCKGNPWILYQSLRQQNAAPFSGFLNFPELQILSSSPERFLKVSESRVETKPIKGTRPRLADLSEDKRQKNKLFESKKDRAENVMIVDLMRNDLSKNCKKGSVQVSKLFTVESFTTVHHLVSTVTGILEQGQHALDLLKNCFPGGSITGAPKIRAMEIIEELEPHRRGVYCGSIGYIGFDGNMDVNIAIRTMVHSENSIRFWAGGGIVNDSVMDEEYQETFDKAAALLALFEQFTLQ